MSAKDFYHPVVVDALVADGWKVTDDPLRLSLGARDFYVDLFAEPVGVPMLETQALRLMVFNPVTRRIERWTPPLSTLTSSSA